MQEKQITVGKRTLQLAEPYCVMATQNPIEQEGTYPLPEAQLDRFLVKLIVGYPKEDEYGTILQRTTSSEEVKLEAVAHGPDILRGREVVRSVPVPDHVQTYAIRLVMGTQPGSEYAPQIVTDNVLLGSSPRGCASSAVGRQGQGPARRSLRCLHRRRCAPPPPQFCGTVS